MEPTYKSVDKFDRLLGSLKGAGDTTHTKPTTIIVYSNVIGAAMTYTVHTIRQREKGDTIFLQYQDDNGSVRLVIPPEVADAIARQRESLTVKVRRRIGKDSAAARKARGEVPAFMKNPGGGKRKGKRKRTKAAQECAACKGYGYFKDNGDPTTDRRERKCLDCTGTGVKP